MLDIPAAPMLGSKIFKRFKTLGIHSSSLGHVTQFHQRRREHFVVVSVGKVFKTYNCSKLGICYTSDLHDAEIQCIAADARHVYTSCSNAVNIFKHNAHVLRVLEGHDCPVRLLMPFNEHLLSVDESSNLKVWHVGSGEKYLDLQFSNSDFEISTMMHPNTYLNKVLLGSKQGKLQLWNVLRGKMIAEFSHWTDAQITVLEQSTAVDVVCVGTEDGDLVLFNIRYDQTIMKFHQDHGPVTCVSFRSDGAQYLASGTNNGKICVWDLDEKCSVGVMKAHQASVAALTFLPGQPLLLSNAGDNSIKIWAFDESDSTGRLLRSRSGHALPPTRLSFHDGSSVVSASDDCTLRVTSAEHASQDKCMGKTSVSKSASYLKLSKRDKKLPAVIDFCMETSRESQWDGMVALHYRHPVVTTWNFERSRKGTHQLLHERFKQDSSRDGTKKQRLPGNVCATSVCLTVCGNFCLVGYSTGHLDVYNVQSGLHRGSYVDKMLQDIGLAHSGAVCAVGVDYLNEVTVSVASEQLVKFWNFKRKRLLSKASLPCAPSFMSLHRESGLIAIALQDFTVAVADAVTRRLVRSFAGHSGKIGDGCWSPSGRWFISASDDCTVHVRDVPSANLVDCLATDTAACAVAMAPNASLLATAHVDDLGIYLWSNSTLFQHVALTPIVLRSVDSFGEDQASDDVAMVTAEPAISDASPANENFLTLTGIPTFKYSCLQSDVIRQRNKPKEPPKKPVRAPFFLPSLLSAEKKPFDDHVPASDDVAVRNAAASLLPLSSFAACLLESKISGDFDAALLRLKDMPFSSYEAEIRTMAPDFGGSDDLIVAFLHLMRQALLKRQECDLVQVCLGLFLKHHTGLLSSLDAVVPLLEDILECVKTQRTEFSSQTNQNLCIVNYVKSATTVLG